MESVDKILVEKGKGAHAGMMKFALGVFAKEPLPGTVKTRLSPPLTFEEAASLYRASLEETVAQMAGAGLAVTLFYSGSEKYFCEAFPGMDREPQRGVNLGERMENALTLLLSKGMSSAALIGTDSPDLPPSLVKEAFEALRNEEFVTIPALDGGYVLVGERRHVPELFKDMPWSTDRVLEETRRRANLCGVKYRELRAWEDVDDLSSLQRLVERSPGSATSRHAIAHLGRCLHRQESE